MSTIHSLRHMPFSEAENRIIRGNLNINTLILAPHTNGTWLLADRSLEHFVICDAPPASSAEFATLKTILDTARLASEGRYLGEPSPADLARDIRRNETQRRPVRHATLELNLDLDL